MLYNSYDKGIMEKSYNLVIFILGVVSIGYGLYALNTVGLSIVVVLNFLFGFLSLFLFFFRKRFDYKLKTLIVIFFLLIIDGFSFFNDGYVGTARILIGGIILISGAFHSIRLAVYVSVVSIIYFLAVTIFYHLELFVIEPELTNRISEISYWYIQLIATVIFIVILIISIKAIRMVLENQVENLNDTLIILDAHKDELERLAYYDKLTKLPTREKFKKDVIELIQDNNSGIMLLLDIRGFSTYNSLFGNDYGDNILKCIGSELNGIIGKDIKACRTGSDEFAIWGKGWSFINAETFFCKFNKKLNEQLKNQNYNHNISWHIGACSFEVDCDDFEKCFRNGIIAIDYSKKFHISGINIFKPEMTKEFEREKEIDFNLINGIKNDEFKVLFQGKHNPNTNKIVGMEALTRWYSKELGFISPVEFISVANNSNHFEVFTKHIFKKSLLRFVDSLDKIPSEVTLSVNISPRFFLEDDFVDFVVRCSSDIEFPKERLILEITEDLLISDIEVIIDKSTQLREHGIKLSLDDFGTGYSSLKYLTTLSFHEIKIDKSFIDNIVESKEAFSLLSSIVAIAKITGYQVVAEGVEYQEQVDSVLKAGCSVIQGYYYSKPVELDELLNL